MSVPTLKELGYGDEVATTPFRGGESVALERMQRVSLSERVSCATLKSQRRPQRR